MLNEQISTLKSAVQDIEARIDSDKKYVAETKLRIKKLERLQAQANEILGIEMEAAASEEVETDEQTDLSA